MASRLDFERGALPLPSRLRIGVQKLALAVRLEGNRALADSGLSPLQAQLLGALARRQRARLTDLARDCGVRAATASEAVRALVGKGLVVRERADSDGRALALSLSRQGRAAATGLEAGLDFLGHSLSRLPQQEQVVFLRAVVALLRDLVASGRLPTVRMCPSCTYFRPNAHLGSARVHHCALVDLAFGESLLRLDCPDFEAAAS